ncbi:lysine decarboxylase, inducable [Xenorhabdus szentirmaii]|nr:lysine decarboxylase, inducable [Xenorhabdus szentirmaii DSM 16338]PHM44132.1 lysine decarboxylase, inducable [Xenorhabdus szentirmaii]
MMADCSPLLLDLNENDPGIMVTQSVHKQQAGFSQASQIHKKDKHIKGQLRYVNHKRFNNSFTAHASTSPFYPLFAALDVNAKMHEGKSGVKMWMDCVKLTVETRKLITQQCAYIKPFMPDMIEGRPWSDYNTDEIANDLRFFNFAPNEKQMVQSLTLPVFVVSFLVKFGEVLYYAIFWRWKKASINSRGLNKNCKVFILSKSKMGAFEFMVTWLNHEMQAVWIGLSG